MTFETKFVATASRAPLLLARLRAGFPSDGEHPDNLIHSVYFDTLNLRGMDEVENGDYHKCKVRVRWYEPLGSRRTTPQRAFLECKAKVGTRRNKHRVELHDLRSDLPLHH